jgi:hypothetical protein
MAYAALPDEVELRRPVPPHDDVFPPEGGQPVGAVVRVVLSPDPEETPVQEPNRAREHAFARAPASAKIGFDPSAQGPQRLGETLDAFELLTVPLAAPIRVVEVLAASRIVRSGSLQVAPLVRADPHVGPGRWDRESAQSLEAVVADRIPSFVEVDEPASVPAT